MPQAPQLILFFLIVTLLAPQARAKMNVDFNPDLDFSKYKTFAYIGGVEHLAMMQLNPAEIRNNVHDAVARELVKRGLKEVNRDNNPDLVVRYFANSQTDVNLAATGDAGWGGFASYFGDDWAYNYDLWSATTSREGSLMIDLIDVKTKRPRLASFPATENHERRQSVAKSRSGNRQGLRKLPAYRQRKARKAQRTRRAPAKGAETTIPVTEV